MTRAEEVLEKDINGDRAEYEVEDVRDKMESSRGSRFQLIENDLVGVDLFTRRRRKISRQSVFNGLKDLSQGFVIHPENRSVQLTLSLYSALNFLSLQLNFLSLL